MTQAPIVAGKEFISLDDGVLHSSGVLTPLPKTRYG